MSKQDPKSSARNFKSPLISPGWSHYIITAPLSPKAHVTLTKKLRELSEQNKSFHPLSASTLKVAIMDLGVLPESAEWLLVQHLNKVIKSHASMKIQATRFRTQHRLDSEPQPQEKQEAFLWLEFRDRVGALAALYQDIEQGLTAYAPQLSRPEPSTWLEDRKFIREFSSLLCGEISSYKSNTYEQAFRSSAWINEVLLEKRPSHFIPTKGYHCVWQHTLPLETPSLVDLDEEVLVSSSNNKDSKKRLQYPLEGKNLELLKALEAELKLLDKESPVSKNSKRRSKRHRHRKSSTRSQTTSQEKL